MLDILAPDEIDELHPKVRPLAEAVVSKASLLLAKIDSGNCQEAEEVAERVASKVPE